eukprot:11672478-Alexandrium_andersonii.AAC.1
MAMCGAILQVEGEVLLEVVQKRMVRLRSQASSVSDGLAGSDEAAQVLDKRDQAFMKEAMDRKSGLEGELK